MLLGGSAQQVPAILKAKNKGYYTVLIDYLPDNPGRLVADKWYSESTTDTEALLKIAKEEKIDGILAYASDPAAIPAAIVANKLGLPGNPLESIKILGLKYLFRKFLKDNGFACPEFRIIDLGKDTSPLEKLMGIKYPCVVKPTDSSGSKGVRVVNSMTEVEDAIRNASAYSRNKILIVEEFIERGHKDIIGGDIVVEGGKIAILGSMTAIRGDEGKSVIPVGEKFPDNLNKETRERIKNELNRLIDLLKLESGQFNIEIIIGTQGEIFFLEVGPRAGGNMIPIQLSDVFATDLITCNVDFAMGESCDINTDPSQGVYVTYVIHSKKEGKFVGIKIDKSLLPFIYRREIYKEKGDRIEYFDGASKAVGILFFKFRDEKEYELMFEGIDEHIEVELTRDHK